MNINKSAILKVIAVDIIIISVIALFSIFPDLLLYVLASIIVLIIFGISQHYIYKLVTGEKNDKSDNDSEYFYYY